MNRSRRNIYIIAAVFAILLVGGVVYAATTGTLNFAGTAGFNTNVRLNIIDETITSPAAGESVSVNPAGDTLTFTVHLSEPGETRYVKFKIENVGNENAILGTLSTTPPTAGSGITVDWPKLNGLEVNSGETKPATGEYEIAVTWDPAYPSVTEDVTLSAGINYSQNVLASPTL